MDVLSENILALISDFEKPSQYIGEEFNSIKVSKEDTLQNFNFCFVYPDVYEVGFPNQAMRILCNAVNDIDGMIAQRAFLPKPEAIAKFKTAEIPMYSLESKSPLYQFDAISITVSHELAATNVCETLDFGGITVLAENRGEDEPIIFGGGPMCCNPEPFVNFFDVITIGEGEKVLPKCLKIVRELREKGFSKKEIFHKLAKVEGTYVPSLYKFSDDDGCAVPTCEDISSCITKTLYSDFSISDPYVDCLVPFVEVTHDRLNVEILRGCARGCRFCQAGFMYRPVRERQAKDIINASLKGLDKTGYDEISLTSLSSTDHSQIKEILEELNRNFEDQGIRVSIPSQRLDNFGVDMAALVAGNKKGGLTFAIEAGSQRLRDVINKNVCEEDLFGAIRSSFSQGWNRCKLYFMIGLPSETDDDIVAISDLCERVLACARKAAGAKRKHGVSISASIAVFVPKAQTPFQWDGIIQPDEALRRVRLIKKNLVSKAIRINYHDPYTSCVEAFISRGSRLVSDVIYKAWQNGAHFDSWDEYFDFTIWDEAASECGFNLINSASKNFPSNEVMPWEHISLGLDRHFLERERKLASKAITTPDCTMGACQNCGVCSSFNVKNILAKERC